MFFFLSPGAHNNKLCGEVSRYPGKKIFFKHTSGIEGIEINHKFVSFPASHPNLIHDYALTAWFEMTTTMKISFFLRAPAKPHWEWKNYAEGWLKFPISWIFYYSNCCFKSQS